MLKDEEWELTVALVATLEGLSLRPETGHGEALAQLRPHVEEALVTLGSLERRRGLYYKERIREEAFRMLLAAIERAE